MATQPGSTPRSTGEKDVNYWKSLLQEWDLSEFEDRFKENGFTHPIDWVHITESDMKELGFKKGHMLRFTRKLKEYSKETAIDVESKYSDHELKEEHSPQSKRPPQQTPGEVLGGDAWIELGEFRMGQVDDSYFSISHRVNRKTCMIFMKDGTICSGPRDDYGLFDKPYIKGLKNVRFGDGWLGLGDWRIGVCDDNRDHLSISHQSGYTCMIWRSDGTRHGGPRKDWNNYWERNAHKEQGIEYGTFCVVDKEDAESGYVKWIQFGDNWRIGDVDSDHFSISSNKAFWKYDAYTTAVVYRRDGTVHPGRRTDLGLWMKKRKYQTVSLVGT